MAIAIWCAGWSVGSFNHSPRSSLSYFPSIHWRRSVRRWKSCPSSSSIWSPAPGEMKLRRSMHRCRCSLRMADAMSRADITSSAGQSTSRSSHDSSSAMQAPHSAPSLSVLFSAGTPK